MAINNVILTVTHIFIVTKAACHVDVYEARHLIWDHRRCVCGLVNLPPWREGRNLINYIILIYMAYSYFCEHSFALPS